jgi:tetratricopeptide (TPR) repeat protein
VIAASLVLLALLGGIAGTTYGLFRAQAARRAEAKQRDLAVLERDRAVSAERQTTIERDKAIAAETQTAIERDKAIASETKAREEAAKSKAINDFLTQDLLTQAEPANNAVEDKVTLLEVLDRAAEKVGPRFADQPEIERALRATMTNTYHGLASWEKAETQVRAALDAERKRDPLSSEAYRAQGELAHILHHRGRRDVEVLEMAESAAKGLERTLGPDHPDTLMTIAKLARAYSDAAKFPEAIALFERVCDAQIKRLGPDHPVTLTTLNNLALAYKETGKLSDAIAIHERVRDAQIAKLGRDHPLTLTTLDNLALAYEETAKLPAAIALFERVRDVRIAKLGPDHPDTLTTLDNLAGAYWRAEQLEKSVPLFEDVLKRRQATLGRQHPDTQITVANLGVNYKDTGRLKEAISLLEEAHQAAKRFPTLLWVDGQLCDAYEKAGRLPEGIALLERLRDAQIAKFGPDHPDTLTTLQNLAAAYWRAKQLDKSVPQFEDLLKRREAKLGRQGVETQRVVANLGVNYKDAGRLNEAIALLEEAHQAAKQFPTLRWVDAQLIDAYMKAGENAKLADLLQEQLRAARKSLPKDSPELAGMLAQIGMGLLQQKKWTEAEPILRECLAIREKTQPDVWNTFNTKSLLGGAFLGQSKFADAEPLLIAGYEGMKQREKTIPLQAQVRLTEALERLVLLYEATSKPDDAARWRKELEARTAAEKQPEKKP